MDFFEKAQARAHAQDILGLRGHPDLEQIRNAYRKLAMEKHPDRGGGTDEEFARINAAYSLLKNDKGFTATDMLHHAPTDSAATTCHSEVHNGAPDASPISQSDQAGRTSSHVRPRRLHTAMTSRISNIGRSDECECQSLLDDTSHLSEPEPDEKSLRASILNVIESSGAPFIPHTNHIPYAIRQSGRRISYIVREPIERGVNRVAVPTGAFSDSRKVVPVIIRFNAEDRGAGTHLVAASTLASSFPGAKSVRVHFGLKKWPKPDFG